MSELFDVDTSSPDYPKWVSRFMGKFDKAGPDDCWEWQGCRNANGYGKTSIPNKIGCKNKWFATSASRAMKFITHGPFDSSLVVRHTCDNPPCVNPAHLLLGTREDNAHDMTDRDRQNKGVEHPRHLFTDEQVITIRERAYAGESFTSLAREYGSQTSAIRSIATGRTWKHLGGPLAKSRKLDRATVATIRKEVHNGTSINQAAKKYGITYPSLVTAVRGRHYGWDMPVQGVPPVLPSGEYKQYV